MENRESDEKCLVCGGEENEEMVGCDGCLGWFHYNCVNLNEFQVSKIKYFFCAICEDKSDGQLTVWKVDKPTASEKIDKRKTILK